MHVRCDDNHVDLARQDSGPVRGNVWPNEGVNLYKDCS
jgi:hypothetical protein